MEWFIIILVVFLALWKASIAAHRKRVEAALTYKPENVHGAASWATDKQLMAADLLGGYGIPIGYSVESGKPIAFKGSTHLITFGGSGKGKTTQALIPAALTWPHSAVFLDINGELAATTAHYRRKFGDVVQINPYGHFMEHLRDIRRVGYNPIGRHWINPIDQQTFGPRSNKAAESCIRQSLDNPYWYSSSTLLAKAFIMFQAEQGKDVHLGKIAGIISSDVFDYARYVCRTTKNQNILNLLARYAAKHAEEIRSLSEVIENTRTESAFLLEPPISDTLSRSDITFSQCKKKVISIYVIMPPSETDGRFFNLFFNAALAELLHQNGSNDKRTLIVADEYRSLGYRKGDEVFATARKYKTQLWVCLQDMAQLKELHPQTSETFINNAGVVQWMAAGDLLGSNYLSDMCGDSERFSTSKSANTDPALPDKLQVTENIGQTARKLILPHEVRELNSDEQILFVDGVKGPIKAKRKPYFATELNRRARPNPYYKPAGVLKGMFR